MTVHRRYLKSTPPPGYQRVRDWEGKRVRTTRQLKNIRTIVPEGSLATVISAGSGTGLHLYFDAGPHMTYVPSNAVQLVTGDDSAKV